MTLHDHGQPHPTSRPAEPPIHVRVDGDHVIIRVLGTLDHDGTMALSEAIDGAIAAGSVAVLDLNDEPGAADLSHALGRTPIAGGTSPTPPHTTAVGSGLLRVPTASLSWTIDVSANRLCRGHPFTERRFVPEEAWIVVQSVSITPDVVIAVTHDGAHLTSSSRRTTDGTTT